MVDLAEPPAYAPTMDQRPIDGDDSPLPEPPALSTSGQRISRAAHAAFNMLNWSTTVPMIRAGLGPWMGSPVGGWVLLLRVRGRKTGLIRDIPLSYLIDEGAAWVMAGFGPKTQWYRNLLADPNVEVLLPGRQRQCVAEDVRDRETRRRIVPKLVRATGLPGYLTGCDPFRSTTDEVLRATAWVPLIRLTPIGEPLVAGPDDPGGLGWVWRQVVALGLSIWVGRRVACSVTGFARRLR